MSDCPDCTALWNCTEGCATDVRCTVCDRRKHLVGRSMSLEGPYLCDDDCPGYRLPPLAPHLWPSEWADHVAGHPKDDE